ncbi:unnamed protein product [Moneuplotes crassus]|uniref:Uncharacterized protein n=1 Tax=Euplotes crassus TaxID=5936 RepID=A0AAD1XPG1_EUPCR|nr:unnamed protein product [Moneuplotes crassus]
MNKKILAVSLDAVNVFTDSSEGNFVVEITCGKASKVIHKQAGGGSFKSKKKVEFIITSENFITVSLLNNQHYEDEVLSSALYSLKDCLISEEDHVRVELIQNGEVIAEVFLELSVCDHKNDSSGGEKDTEMPIINSYDANEHNKEFFGAHLNYSAMPSYSHASSIPMKGLYQDLGEELIVSEFKTVSDHRSDRKSFDSSEDAEFHDHFEISPEKWLEDHSSSRKLSNPTPPSYTVPYNPFSSLK